MHNKAENKMREFVVCRKFSCLKHTSITYVSVTTKYVFSKHFSRTNCAKSVRGEGECFSEQLYIWLCSISSAHVFFFIFHQLCIVRTQELFFLSFRMPCGARYFWRYFFAYFEQVSTTIMLFWLVLKIIELELSRLRLKVVRRTKTVAKKTRTVQLISIH